ncbi:apolipoprotein O-like [Silurus asotus]|uniref:Apolipoprotein O-like n=1 Tax=Silurus asotus TaxID=30991 RepID=A0AAD5B925_SILAS|nr:apolipoprotein O-like [Silurus asotus]
MCGGETRTAADQAGADESATSALCQGRAGEHKGRRLVYKDVVAETLWFLLKAADPHGKRSHPCAANKQTACRLFTFRPRRKTASPFFFFTRCDAKTPFSNISSWIQSFFPEKPPGHRFFCRMYEVMKLYKDFEMMGSRLKRLVLPLGLMTAGAAVCYPMHTVGVLKVTGKKVYAASSLVASAFKPKEKSVVPDACLKHPSEEAVIKVDHQLDGLLEKVPWFPEQESGLEDASVPNELSPVSRVSPTTDVNVVVPKASSATDVIVDDVAPASEGSSTSSAAVGIPQVEVVSVVDRTVGTDFVPEELIPSGETITPAETAVDPKELTDFKVSPAEEAPVDIAPDISPAEAVVVVQDHLAEISPAVGNTSDIMEFKQVIERLPEYAVPLAKAAPLDPEKTTPSPFAPEKTTSSPLFPDETTPSPLFPDETTPSPFAPEKTTSSPLAAEKTTSSPLDPEEDTTPPLAPEKTTSSPLDPEAGTSSPLAPEKTTSSPLDPKAGTSSPLAPEKTTSSPLDPEGGTSSPLAPEQTTSSPLEPEKATPSPLAPEETTPSPLAPEETTPSPLAPEETTHSPLAPEAPEGTTPSPLAPEETTPSPLSPEETTAPPAVEVATSQAKGKTRFVPDPSLLDHGQAHPEDADLYSTRGKN